MASLVTEYPQENLCEISRIQFRKLVEKVKHNYFLKLTRNSYFTGDFKASVRWSGDFANRRILMVAHFVSKPKGGLTTKYKVDRELWDLYVEKFGN